VSKPHRFSVLASSGVFVVFNDLSFILAALLVMMPFGLIPFSNTLPAVAVNFLAIGMMQRDGVSILFGHLMNLATIAYFGFIVIGGGWSLLQILS